MPIAANFAVSVSCVNRMSKPTAKHPPLTARVTASFTVPSYASCSYARAASAPGIQHAASLAPCDSAVGRYGSPPRSCGTHVTGTSQLGRGIPRARTTSATSTGTEVTTSASAIGNPRSSMRAAVNRSFMLVPNSMPALNSATRSTFSSSSADPPPSASTCSLLSRATGGGPGAGSASSSPRAALRSTDPAGCLRVVVPPTPPRRRPPPSATPPPVP
mmetsp:Transcript_18394/g.45825  ORF Transcript_18394/g.45825 Transcript_18394/m.45825 type:complete len:217 (+) Transcript_18394:213-863(+)